MKRGQIVAVCHYGKFSRRVKGVIVATRNGHHVKVQFPHPDTGEPVEFWARRRDDSTRYARNNSFYRYGGWADIDKWFPWYGIYHWKD